MNDTDYADNTVYRARIIDQSLTHSATGHLQVILTVLILARLADGEDLDSESIACPEREEHEVWITIVPDDDNRLRMALRDLDRLGFQGDDIRRLHPDHNDPIRLVDKEVHVRMKTVNDHKYWNLCWPRSKPKLAELEPLADSLKERIAAARRKAGAKSKDDARGASAAEQPGARS
jgi:hypothetical protein